MSIMVGVWDCLVLVLVSASLQKRVDAAPQPDLDHAFLAYSLDFDNCNDINDSSSRESKKAADDACKQAFLALDRIKLNHCQNWRDAGCRLIPGQTYRQCSCVVSYNGDSSFITTPLRECVKSIASEEPSTTVEVAQSKKRRRSKHDNAQKSARKRHASVADGGAGTSSRPKSSGRADGSIDVPIGGGASTSGGVQIAGAAVESASQRLRVDPGEGIPARFPCPVCKRKYVYARTLREHMKSHDTDETKCPVCHRTYSIKVNLRIHMESAHPGTSIPEKAARPVVDKSGPFVCEECGKEYTTWKILQSHKRKHNTFDTHCFHCKMTYSSRAAYKKHLQDNHPEDAFAEEEAEKKRYIEENPEVCGICNKRFKNIDGLWVHKRIHDGKTKCDVCGAVFKRVYLLNAHKKKEHPKREHQN